jgi:hypothetical protein
MSTEKPDKIGEVPLSVFNRFAATVNKHYQGSPENDPRLSFELIIGSLFPVCYDNVRKEILLQHGLGYKQGYEDGLNESKRNS